MDVNKLFTNKNGVMWLFGTPRHDHFSFKFSVLLSEFTVYVMYGYGTIISDCNGIYEDKHKICGIKIVVLENAVFHNYIFHVRYNSSDIDKCLNALETKIMKWMRLSHSHVFCENLVEKVVKNVICGINSNILLI